MAECGLYIGKGAVSYPCQIEGRGHDGPCMAPELARTVREREHWEAEQRHQASGLAEFQGPPETTAHRYTDNATEPPLTQEQREERAASASARVFRGGTVGEALDKADVPIITDPTAPAAPGRPTRADREHDQPLPVPNDEVSIQDRLIEMIEQRKAIGLERYGTLLQPHNGRDALRDAFEEALDLTLYLLQAIVERDGGGRN